MVSSQAKSEVLAAVQASEAAFEVSEVLREKLQLIARERDTAKSQVCLSVGGVILVAVSGLCLIQVEDLRELATRLQSSEKIR